MSEDKYLLWLETCPRCQAVFKVYEVDDEVGKGHKTEYEKVKAAEVAALILMGYQQQEFIKGWCHSCHWDMRRWGKKWR